MNFTKRILAVLLILISVFGLYLPVVFAQEEPLDEQSNPAMPVITEQPKNFLATELRVFDRTVTLSVQAYIPNGDEIGYRWYNNFNEIIGETPEINVNASSPVRRRYYVEVYNLSNPEYYVTSDIATVNIDSISENLTAFIFAPLGYPLALIALAGPVGLLVSIPLLPLFLIMAPVVWIQTAINMIRGKTY